MKPVIALDVDGVLNAGGSPEDLGKGWQLHRVEVPAEHVPLSPFIGGGGGHQKALTVNINPGLHGRWINELSETVDFAWATTWEDAANYALAPLLGIAELPVATAVKRTRPRFGDTVIEWKARSLDEAYPSRPVVWIDDLNAPLPVELAQRRSPPRYAAAGGHHGSALRPA